MSLFYSISYSSRTYPFYVALNGWKQWIMWMGKDTTVARSRNLPEEIEENHESSQSGEPVSRAKLNPSPPAKWVRTGSALAQARSRRGASGCTTPSTNLAASTRNLLNIKDKHNDQPAEKGETFYRMHVLTLLNRRDKKQLERVPPRSLFRRFWTIGSCTDINNDVTLNKTTCTGTVHVRSVWIIAYECIS
jgi:hypothetical protein